MHDDEIVFVHQIDMMKKMESQENCDIANKTTNNKLSFLLFNKNAALICIELLYMFIDIFSFI